LEREGWRAYSDIGSDATTLMPDDDDGHRELT